MSDELLIPDEYLFQKRADSKILPPGNLKVVTPPNIGWSVFGQLTTRNSVNVPDPPDQLSLQVQFDRQMQTHTVQFNAPDNDINLTGTGIICEAELLWSVEGVTVRRVVSVLDGMAVSGEAQSVTVNIYDMSLTNTVTPYSVGCTVAPGVRGSIHQPPILRVNGSRNAGGVVTSPHPFSVTLVPGAVVSYTIPPNVGAVSSYATARAATGTAELLNGDVEITHEAISGAIMRSLDLRSTNIFVPLFPITKVIRVQNNRAVGNINVSHLLGIEG